MGLTCYLNKQTGEVKEVIDQFSFPDADMELWEETIKKIEDDRGNYVRIRKMSYRKSLHIMEDFIENMDSSRLQVKLIGTLNRVKPFKNFRNIIDNSEEHREEWFKYRQSRYMDYVRSEMDEKGLADFLE